MRDERTEREHLKKLFMYIHKITVKPKFEEQYLELDNMLDSQKPAKYRTKTS